MTDRNATAQRPLDIASGEMAMSRLADRLASMAPPPLNLTAAQVAPMLRPSPAVAGALSTSAAVQFQSRPG